MPITITSNLKTSQPYIPLVDDGDQVKIGGVPLLFDSAADLKAKCTMQRTNIENGLGLWKNGTPLRVVTEPVARTWIRGTGSSDAANAAASSAKTFTLPFGTVITLLDEANTLTAVTVIPAAGDGANGDQAWDRSTGMIYTKTAGAWVQSSVDGGGNSVGSDKNLGGSVLINWATVSIGSVTAGWTVTLDNTNKYSGLPTLNVSAAAGAADTLVVPLTIPSTYLGASKRLVIPVGTADTAVAGSVSNLVQIWTHDDSVAGANRFLSFGYASHCPGDWAEGVVINGDTNGSGHVLNTNWTEISGRSYTRLQLVMTKAAGKAVSRVNIGPIYADPARTSKALLTIFMDGNYLGQYTYARSILQKYGLTSSLAFIRSRIGMGGSMTQAQMQQMYDGGHELIHHHGSGAEVGWDNTTKYPDGQEYALIKADIVSNQEYLAANGFMRGIGYGVVGFTNGLSPTQTLERRTNIANAIRDGGLKKVRQLQAFQACYYGCGGGNANTIVTPSQLIGSSETVDTVKTVIDKIEARGGWSGLTFHDFALSGAIGNNVNTPVFDGVCQYLSDRIKAGGISVVNFSDAMRTMTSIAAPT